jgi:hypothetical protein
MPKEFPLTGKFKLILDHLKAVRALDEYVSGVGLKTDMQALATYIRHDLNRGILRPAGWKDLQPKKGLLYSSPEGSSTMNCYVPRWCVGEDEEDDFIAIEISPAGPVRADDDPYVNLYVPENWEKRNQFIAKVKAPQGFQHVSQHSEGEHLDTTSIFKYLPYESYVGPDGRLDADGFIDGFREATKALVALDKDIDQILVSLG